MSWMPRNKNVTGSKKDRMNWTSVSETDSSFFRIAWSTSISVRSRISFSLDTIISNASIHSSFRANLRTKFRPLRCTA